MQKDRFSLLIIALVLLSPVEGLATELDEESETPSMELLEFLAEFETDDGSWVGPSVLESMVETGWSGEALEVVKDE